MDIDHIRLYDKKNVVNYINLSLDRHVWTDPVHIKPP